MLGWIDLKLCMAVCWKVSWNVDPLPLSVPERPELPPPPPPPLDDEPQAATNKAIAARASPATVNRCLCRPCMSDTPPFLGCYEHQTPPGPKPGMRTLLARRVCRAARTRELRGGVRSAKNRETKDERKVICTLPTGGPREGRSAFSRLPLARWTRSDMLAYPWYHAGGGLVLGLRPAAHRTMFC